MKIAVFSFDLPLPCENGYTIYVWNICLALKALGHDLSLFANIDEERRHDAYSNKLEEVFQNIVLLDKKESSSKSFMASVFRKTPFLTYRLLTGKNEESISSHFSDFDLALFNYLYYSPLLRLKPDGARTNVLIQHNVDSEVYRIAAKERKRVERIHAFVEGSIVRSFEQREMHNFDYCISITEQDKALTQNRVKNLPKLGIGVLPPFNKEIEDIDLEEVKRTENRIVISGSNQRYNKTGVSYFVTKVLRRIVPEVPGVTVLVVGNMDTSKLPEEVRKNPLVTFTGRVARTIDHVASGKVYVAPYFQGGGAKIRLLEPMRLGVPVVGTKESLKGYDLKDGVSCLIAEDEEQFAEKIIELLKNATLFDKISRGIQNRYRESFSFSCGVENTSQILSFLNEKAK